MRILHYVPSLDPVRGGPVRAVFDLSAGLAQAGHEVSVLTTELAPDPAAAGQVSRKGLKVELLEGPMVGAKSLDRARFERLCRAIDTHDVLHVHGAWTHSNAQASAYARRVHKPYIVSLRGMLDDWSMDQKALKKRVYLAVFGRKHLERAAFVHCTAQGELEQSRKWFPQGVGRVIPNFLNLEPFRTLPGAGRALAAFPAIDTTRRRVLFLSRLHYKKGSDVFLRAAKVATERGLDATWVLAGSGDPPYEREMRELAQALGVDDRCVFTGHVGGEVKTSLYQACDVFALPTSQENFGFVFPESLACGTPVITTKGVDIWPELQSSGGAVIVDRTPEAFADAVQRVLSDSLHCAKMGKLGRDWVLAEFEESRLIARYVEMYSIAKSS